MRADRIKQQVQSLAMLKYEFKAHEYDILSADRDIIPAGLRRVAKECVHRGFEHELRLVAGCGDRCLGLLQSPSISASLSIGRFLFQGYQVMVFRLRHLNAIDLYNAASSKMA